MKTPEQIVTARRLVERYRDQCTNGHHDWYLRLLSDWRTGADVNALEERPGDTMNLRGVRNQFGPSWLFENYGPDGGS